MSRALCASLLALSLPLGGCGSDASAPREPTPAPPETADLLSAVNPFIASGGGGFAVGSAYPGPAQPFAMIHPGPDTRTAGGAFDATHCSGYHWDDDLIGGFSLTRMHGTGVPDYGNFAFMPLDGMRDEATTAQGYASAFRHEDEHAEAGYYRVGLENGIQVEITSTRRAALFRLQFPEHMAKPSLLLDAAHTLGGTTSLARASAGLDGKLTASVHNDGPLSGRFGGYDLHAAGALEPPPVALGAWDDAGLRPGESQGSGVWLEFAPGTRQVSLRVAVSFVDAAGAEANLAAELPGFDFDATREAARAGWQRVFEGLEIGGIDERDATILGTALYHAHLMPSLMSDVDGRAVGVTGAVVQSELERFSDFSLWDTYRTQHPWFLLTESGYNTAFARSLIQMAEEGGAVPRWALARGDAHSMIGSPGEIVLAESFLKGVELTPADYDRARVAAFGPSPGPSGGRGSIEDYLALGYVPADRASGGVSKTQEYAVADRALSLWAEQLGRSDDAAQLAQRGDSWRGLYNPETGFFQAKNADGSFKPLSVPTAAAPEYTEGDAWQYLWMVPHDPQGLAETLGGEQAALARLREFFQLSVTETPIAGHRMYYWHGNEPDLIAPWLFAVWGERDETGDWLRWAYDEFYGTEADGLAGNDDAGTLSAWALFAAMGIYPDAGSDRYIVGVPLVPYAVIHRGSGDLTMRASADPKTHRHVVRVELDGVEVRAPYLRHADLAGDHLLSFTLE